MAHEITALRLKQLLTSYGADPARWPEAEREAAVMLLASDPAARRMQQEAASLDEWLVRSPVPAFAGLESRLLQQALPARGLGLADWLASWLRPSSEHPLRSLWRPAAVACVPLVLGLLIGGQFDFGGEVYASAPLEEELYMISLSDYAEIL